MVETEINLTEQERYALQEISRRTGKTEGELIHEAIHTLIAQLQDEFDGRAKEGRHFFMQKAKGIWKDRQDLPSPEDLRREWDRF